jgi:hypothetical protein
MAVSALGTQCTQAKSDVGVYMWRNRLLAVPGRRHVRMEKKPISMKKGPEGEGQQLGCSKDVGRSAVWRRWEVRCVATLPPYCSMGVRAFVRRQSAATRGTGL